jgi:dipeptidyl aminopeptidase/acylaminoacyl peptidase
MRDRGGSVGGARGVVRSRSSGQHRSAQVVSIEEETVRHFAFAALLALLLAVPAEAVGAATARPVVYSKVDWEWAGPDGSRVLVERGGLFAVRNGEARQLTDVPGDRQPSVAPNGGTIVFVRGGDLYSMEADGSGRRQLTDGPEFDECPLVSPDGRYVLFTRRSERNAPGDLHTVPLGGGALVTVTAGPEDDREASFSRDGRAIVFVRSLPVTGGGTNEEIYSVRPNGVGLARLTESPQDEIHPRYFARGIVFDRRTRAGRGPSAVFTMRRDGRRVRTAATGGRGAGVAAVSPNGRVLLFNRFGHRGDNLWRAGLAGSGEHWSRPTLLADSSGRNLVFSPDGRRVAGTFSFPGGWGCCSFLATVDIRTGHSQSLGETWQPEPPGPIHTSVDSWIGW